MPTATESEGLCSIAVNNSPTLAIHNSLHSLDIRDSSGNVTCLSPIGSLDNGDMNCSQPIGRHSLTEVPEPEGCEGTYGCHATSCSIKPWKCSD